MNSASEHPTPEHPTPEQLREFGLGRLDDHARDAIERHVADCDSCCESLGHLGDDTLVELARAVADTDCYGGLSPTPPETRADRSGGAAPDDEVEPVLANHPKYRILGILGRGGMGVVYKAQHRYMDRLLALKVVRRSLTNHPTAIERFKIEARAAARLSHPNIVTAYDCEDLGDCHFLAMEYVPGVSLDRLVAAQGRLAPDLACRLIAQAALGLEHAHGHGMVHRDIKPQNLLVTRDGLLKILDFGLARFASEQRADTPSDLTTDGSFLGTPDYIAPEQIDDPRQADIRADIYSLGATLYYLLAGRPLFASGTTMQKLKAHCATPHVPLSKLRNDIPPALDAALDKMLAKDPDRRFSRPAEVAAALDAFGDGRWKKAPTKAERPDQNSPAEVVAESAGLASEAPVSVTPVSVTPVSPGGVDEPLVELANSGGFAAAEDSFADPAPACSAAPQAVLPRRPGPGGRRRSSRNRRLKWWGGAGAVVAIGLAAWLVSRPGRSPGPSREGGAAVAKGGWMDPAVGPGAGASPDRGAGPGGAVAATVGAAPRVLFYVPSSFWDPDYTAVRPALDRAQIEVTVCADAPRVFSENPDRPSTTVVSDITLQEALQTADRYQMLVLAGKFKIDESLQRPEVIALVRAFHERGKLIGAICKSQQILDRAGVLKGKRISKISPYNEGQLATAGFVTSETVSRDGQLITATEGEPEVAEQFGRQLVRALTED